MKAWQLILGIAAVAGVGVVLAGSGPSFPDRAPPPPPLPLKGTVTGAGLQIERGDETVAMFDYEDGRDLKSTWAGNAIDWMLSELPGVPVTIYWAEGGSTLAAYIKQAIGNRPGAAVLYKVIEGQG